MEKISKTPYEINKEFISNMDDDLFIQEYFSIMERCSDSPDLRSYVEYSINEYNKDNSSYSFSLKLNDINHFAGFDCGDSQSTYYVSNTPINSVLAIENKIDNTYSNFFVDLTDYDFNSAISANDEEYSLAA